MSRAPRLLLTALLPLAGCERAPPPSPAGEQAAAEVAWHYRVRIAPRAEAADVDLCFGYAPSGNLVPSNKAGYDYIDRVRVAGSPTRMRRRGGAYELSSVRAGDCVSYHVDFSAMAREEGGGRRVRAIGNSVLIRPSMWLWRPDRIPDDVAITLDLELADGIDASVPWAVRKGERGGRKTSFNLDPTVYTWLGYTAFGELGLDRFEAGGTRVEVALLDAELACTPEGRRTWIRDAAESVAMLYGRFPREHLQVVVVPVEGWGSGTVHFGAAGRGGGAGVYILMDEGAEDDDLPGGWTTVHELLHHGMPFVEDPWMGEGWVSYYTELMRTRMGHRTEEQGWQKLYDAFRRGQRSRRTISLQRSSDRMHSNFAYQRVYWGGAAIAFFIDVAMRRDKDDERTLDDAVKELRRCCGEAHHKFSGKELLEKLDTWYGEPIFTRIAGEQLQDSKFPPFEDVFGELGITLEDGTVVLDDAHPMAAIRRSIMAPRR